MTIKEIIEKSGGPKAIGDAIAAARGKPSKPDAVYKWPAIGIPDRHWPIIISLSGVTAQELFEANLEARGEAVA